LPSPASQQYGANTFRDDLADVFQARAVVEFLGFSKPADPAALHVLVEF